MHEADGTPKGGAVVENEAAPTTADHQVRPLFSGTRYRVPYDQLDAVEEVNMGLVIDFNGHQMSGELDDGTGEYARRVMRFTSVEVSSGEEFLTYLEAARTRVPLAKPVKLFCFRDKCDLCGVELRDAVTDGVTARYEKPCAYPNGLLPNEWYLDVPSGVMVVADDLRDLFPLPDPGERLPSVNTPHGRQQVSSIYAAAGLAHGFVGGVIPSVYLLDHGGYEIASYGWDEETDERVTPPGAVEVAYVRTDSRWYSICDRDDFLRRCERLGHDPEKFTLQEVEVGPGRYLFEHDDMVAFMGRRGQAYCRFRRAGPVQAP